MYGYGQCPRCGQMSLEHLRTHSHCWECGYSPDLEHPRTRIAKQLEKEAHLADKFAQNELGYREVFDGNEKANELSDEALEDYHQEQLCKSKVAL